MAEIVEGMMMAKELGLTHLGNGELDLTDERVSNLDYLQNVLQQEMDMRQQTRAKKNTKRSRPICANCMIFGARRITQEGSSHGLLDF